MDKVLNIISEKNAMELIDHIDEDFKDSSNVKSKSVQKVRKKPKKGGVATSISAQPQEVSDKPKDNPQMTHVVAIEQGNIRDSETNCNINSSDLVKELAVKITEVLPNEIPTEIKDKDKVKQEALPSMLIPEFMEKVVKTYLVQKENTTSNINYSLFNSISEFKELSLTTSLTTSMILDDLSQNMVVDSADDKSDSSNSKSKFYTITLQTNLTT